MKVEMIDGLAAVLGGIDHDSISLGKSVLPCQIGSDPQQVSEQRRMLLAGLVERSQVFTGNNQNMDRSLRMDVGKCKAFVVLVQSLRRDASFDDPAE